MRIAILEFVCGGGLRSVSLKIREKKNRTIADCIMVAIFVILLGSLGIMLVTVGCREQIIQSRILARAVPVEATILSNKVTSSDSMNTDTRMLHDNSTTSHTPEVRFAYYIQDDRFESDLLYPTIVGSSFSSEEAAWAEIAKYKVGATARAFVNTSYPDRGFLRMEKSSRPACFIAGGILSFVLLAVLIRFI